MTSRATRSGFRAAGGADDLDRFGELAGLQRDVDARDLRDLQREAAADRLAEPRRFPRSPSSRQDGGSAHVGPGAVGLGLDADIGLDVGDVTVARGTIAPD